MATLFNSLKELVTPQLISSASSFLGEDQSKVTSAVTAAIPSILGAFLYKGNSPEVESIVKSAGSSDLLSNVTDLFSGKGSDLSNKVSSGFLNSLFGDKLGAFTSLISGSSGISEGSVGKLFPMIASLVTGFFGNKLQTSGLSFSGLLSQLGSEKDSFSSLIPSGLSSVLGISSLSALGSSLLGSAGDKVSDLASKGKEVFDDIDVKGNSNGGGFDWLKWLLPILAVGGLLYWLFNSNMCSSKTPEVPEIAVVGSLPVPEVEVPSISNAVRELINVKLPSGLELKAFKGGIEDQMVRFLTSEEYKNATPEELKSKWFEFDNINFEFGSANKITKESEPQIQNIVAILKEFKDAKIKLGAYTDKKGDKAINLKLSQERANAIKSFLTKNGVGVAQITGAEGYGSEFAEIAESASDEERAVDRKIAIRFEK